VPVALCKGEAVIRKGLHDVISLLRIHLVRDGSLSDRDLERVASLVTVRSVERGTTIVAPGEVCAFEGIVARGCLRVFFSEWDGSERVLYFAPEGWWVADIESFLSERPTALGIDAVEATDILTIDKPSLALLGDRIPGGERLIRMLAEETLARLQRRLVGSMRKTAAQRYHEFLSLYPGLEARIPQYEIAAYLAISAEFLSKLRKRLRGTGFRTPDEATLREKKTRSS
jgi:CRP-like cAMP-binding protein